MSDYNGRIGAIMRAIRSDDPEDIVSARMAIRQVLQAERTEGYHEGHGDGLEDQRAGDRAERQRLAKAHESFVRELLELAPIEWATQGTPEEALAAYLGTAVALAERHLGRLPVPGDGEAPEDGDE